MTDIQTVAGPVDSGALGRTLVHEHVFVLGEEYRQNYQDDWDEDEKVEQAVRDLNELKSPASTPSSTPRCWGSADSFRASSALRRERI